MMTGFMINNEETVYTTVKPALVTTSVKQ